MNIKSKMQIIFDLYMSSNVNLDKITVNRNMKENLSLKYEVVMLTWFIGARSSWHFLSG